jgi:hypothetical protein
VLQEMLKIKLLMLHEKTRKKRKTCCSDFHEIVHDYHKNAEIQLLYLLIFFISIRDHKRIIIVIGDHVFSVPSTI